MWAGLSPALLLLGSALPQRAEEERFLQRSQRDARRDVNRKTMTLVGGKDQGFKIISEEWSAH
jgi:hypothetical protein